jgi:transcriptional regulator with XRE-family HTH domain
VKASEFRRLRHLSGMTQEQAARICGVAHRTILRWEHGDSRIRPLEAQAIRLRLVSTLFGQDSKDDGEGVAKPTYR